MNLGKHGDNMRYWLTRFIIFDFLLLIFYNEYLVYVLKPMFSWPEIKCADTGNCTKILVVADPQILGDTHEYLWSRLDNDRYLRSSFVVAFNYVEPDGVIFLGDLMDEGSQADDEQFDSYYRRFKNIFHLDTMSYGRLPMIFLPGDNDIGGEGMEIIKADNVKRFRKFFGQRDSDSVKNIHVLKVNKLLRTYPSKDEKFDGKNFKFNIAVSHMPLTTSLSPFAKHVVEDLKPEFIFSAHEHKSFALLTLKEEGRRLYYEELVRNPYKNMEPTWTFQSARSTNYSIITEIVVPTCSYRMGVSDMGFGVVVFGEDPSKIVYHVLWLPSRFMNLFMYLLCFVVFSICISINCSYLRRLNGRYCHFRQCAQEL